MVSYSRFSRMGWVFPLLFLFMFAKGQVLAIEANDHSLPDGDIKITDSSAHISTPSLSTDSLRIDTSKSTILPARIIPKSSSIDTALDRIIDSTLTRENPKKLPSKAENQTILDLLPLEIQGNSYHKIMESTRSVSFIRPSEWEGTQKSLADVIAEQTGIQTRRYGGTGSFQTVSIRGVQGEEVCVLLDGIPLNSAMGGAVDLGRINLDIVEEIEVYKGLTPAKFGGNGLGGVVNIKTKASVHKNSVNAHTSIGAYGYQKYGVTLAHSPLAQVKILSLLSFLKADNDWKYRNRNRTPYNLEDDSIDRVLNAGLTSMDVLFQPEVFLGGDKVLKSALYYSLLKKGLPAREGHINPTTLNDNEQFSFNLSLPALEYKGSWNYQLLSNLGYYRVSDKLRWTSLDEDMSTAHSLTGSTANSLGTTKSDLSIANISLIHSLSLIDFFHSEMVFQAIHSQINSSAKATGFPMGDYPGESTEFSFAIEADSKKEWSKNWSTGVSMGGATQLIRNVSEGGYNALLATSYRPSDSLEIAWSAQSGFNAKWNQQFSLYFNMGRFSNTPSLQQRYGTKGAILANPELLQETGITWELGSKIQRKQWKNLFAELIYFRTTMENGILLLPGGAMVKPTNLASSKIEGIEGTFQMQPLSKLNLELRSTWQKPLNTSKVNNYAGNDLPNEPRLSALGKMGFGPLHGFHFSYWTEYKSAFYRDNGNLLRVPENGSHTSRSLRLLAEFVNHEDISGILFHNIQVSWKSKKHIDASFSIRNITSESLNQSDPSLYESGYEWTLYPANEWLLKVGYTF